MSLLSSDLFFVQRGNNPHKMTASHIIDYVAASPAVHYLGTCDCTAPVGSQLDPNPPLPGDLYINQGTGNVDSSGSDSTDAWVGIQGNPITEGQRVVYDGSSWEIVGNASGGDVIQVTGTAPINVTGDADSPVIGIDDATKTDTGSTRLALDPPNAGDLTSTADTDVLSVPHFNELAGRISTAAGGGIQSVTGDNGVTSSGTTNVTVSGVDATTGVKGVVQLTDAVTTNSTQAVTGTAVEGYAVPLNINSLSSLP